MDKLGKRLLAVVLAAVLLVGGVGVIGVSAANDITAAFTDTNFLEAVREVVEKPAPQPILDMDVQEITSLIVVERNIRSLAGLEYFTGLEELNCGLNQLTSLPALPSGLIDLHCGGNLLTELPALPSGLIYLNCVANLLTELPALPSTLITLSCEKNLLSELPALPSGMIVLYCEYNQLTHLPELPSTLDTLNCSDNLLTELPELPSGLTTLICENNQLTELPALPPLMWTLCCGDNQLTSLPGLPSGLDVLWCYNNQLTALPTLPSGLRELLCHDNKLTGIDVTGLPLTFYLWCQRNNMTSPADVIGFTYQWDGVRYIFDQQNDLGGTTKYTLTVTGGTGGGEYEAGAQVTITLDPAKIPSGKVFDKWTATAGTLADANSAATTFTMPAGAATISATYKTETCIHIEQTVTIPSTCTVQGMSYVICTKCEVDPWNITVLPLAAHIGGTATCTEKAVCTYCSLPYGEALGHDYAGTFTTDLAATCTTAGSKSRHCSRCDSKIDVTAISATGHIEKTNTVASSCTVQGMSYVVCTVCEANISSTVLPLAAHTFGAWAVTKPATTAADGEEKRVCSVCQFAETRSIPKIVVTVLEDNNTAVKVEFAPGVFDGDVTLAVEEIFSGGAFNIIDLNLNSSQSCIFDIKLTKNGVNVQPNGLVTVRIPLPDGYDPARTRIFYISNEAGGQVENMNARVEGGYLVFETDHFSHYAVVELAEETDNTQCFKLWGKVTGWKKTIWNWILLVVCFGWIWMAF